MSQTHNQNSRPTPRLTPSPAPSPAPRPTPSDSTPTGGDRIAQTLSQWRRQLLDTSKISKLINCKFSRGTGGIGAGGALLLEHPAAQSLWEALVIHENSMPFAWASTLLPNTTQESAPTLPSTPGQSVPAPPRLPAPEPTDHIAEDQPSPHKSARVNLNPDEINSCIASPALKADELLTGLFDKRLDATLKRMSLAAQTSLSEQGINSLFLAFGFIHWFDSADSDIEIISPLLLVPVALSKEHGQSTWMLKPLDEEIAVNHSLAELCRSDFRIDLPAAEDEQLRSSPEMLDHYLQSISEVISAQTRWKVEDRAALGSFGFQKISMWQDLRRNESRIIDHPLCRSIAGDADAMFYGEAGEASADAVAIAAPGDEDDIDSNPAAHHLILDCDGSQLAAVTAVKNGSHLILDGPPGTGKSQTIANMIAETLAAGKTVLFVSEKSAALEVVKRRLDARKLGDFCLECHSHKSNKRTVIEELGRCLSHPPEHYPAQDEKLAELNRCQDRLNRYVRALHASRSELELSAYQAHARLAPLQLAALQSAPVSRIDIADPHRVSKTQLRLMEETVARLIQSESIIAQRGEHSWKGCRPERITLSFVDDAEHHFKQAADALDRRRLAATALVALELLSDPFTESQLQQSRQRAKAAASFPLVPEAWVKDGLRESADAYIRLDEMAGEFRIAMTAAELFNRATLGSAPLEVFQQLDPLATALRPLLPGLPSSMRETQKHLRHVQLLLSASLETIDPLCGAASALLKLLDLPASAAATSRDLQVLAEAGAAIAASGKVPDAWFDASHRAKLKTALKEAQQAAEFARLARKPLEDRLQPIAFNSASVAVADELIQHSSFFARFGSKWRRARIAFGGLYAATPPNNRTMLDDAYLLKKCRAAADAFNAAAQNADGENFGWDGSIEFGWTVASARLMQFDAIAPAILESSGFSQIATHLDAAALSSIRTGVAGVESKRSAFESAFALLTEVVAPAAVLGVDEPRDAELRQLQARLQTLQEKLAATDAAITTALSFLTEAADPLLDQLPQDVDVLITLRKLHGDATTLAEKLNETFPPIENGGLCDFASQAKLGQWVKKFVDHFAGNPPAAMIRLLVNRDAREKLAAGIKALDAADTAALASSIKFVTDAFPDDQPISGGIVLKQATELERISWLSERSRDAKASLEWRDYLDTSAELQRVGLAVLRDEVLSGTIAPKAALPAFRARFYKRWLDEAYQNEPLLREFDPGVHEQTAERFRELDRYWIHNGFARIRPALLEQCPNPTRLGGTPPNTSEIGVLLRETNKRRRHLPLRKLFAAMPTLLQRLKPCIMMSPLAVSTYFESCEVQFDLVIFDEASQVRPHDAICAIYRGKQLVVAGDQKQLPPTNFFERLTAEESDDEDEETISTNDYESILDTCASLGLPRQRLKWHYRSKRESLISFSNRNFYDGELITFPSVFDVDSSSGVTFHFIEDARRGKTGSVTNAIEATRIAEAVVRHAATHSEKSLGVITMNVGQQMLVMDEISRLRKNDSRSESFFSSENREPFFVKNLENVQGDERDFIFIGIGFAKNEAGKLSHSFGPLNRSGGERRLNVAVTRARESLCVFSSIKAQDIDRSRTTAIGPALLQAYLDFAERGPIALLGTNTESAGAQNDSEFEAEVERALRDHGLEVRRQVGCCGYRIDLAIVDPARPGRYVLGVEADGATYHSSASARDRDRLRQELLESLGWRIARIWSTDWIRNPQRQIERVLKAYQAALASADIDADVAADVTADVAADVAVQPSTVSSVDTIQPTAAGGHCDASAPAAARIYGSIDSVPPHVIQQALHDRLREFGSMDQEELLQHTARSFGFTRMGSKIRERLGQSLRELARLQSVRIVDDRVSLAAAS